MIDERFVILGSLIQLVGVASYLVGTIQGKIKPNRVPFFLWAFLSFVAFSAEIYQGVGIQSLMTFAQGFFPALILIASFTNRRSAWKLTKFDLICGVFSVLGLFLWYMTKVGNVAIAFSIFADVFASLPTIVKSFNHPETESAWPWLTPSINAFITILTIRVWNFANVGFPVYIFGVNLVIFTLIQFKIGKLAVDTRLRA